MSVRLRSLATVSVLVVVASACSKPSQAQSPGSPSAQAKSCGQLHAADPSLGDGAYLIDPDGPGPLQPRSLYCDMRSGGWTLVANQVPGSVLPDRVTTINNAGFGAQDQSYRLGDPEIDAVVPSVAWKLTDGVTSVFFRPACTVSWKKNYADSRRPTDCTAGYDSEQFTSIVNGQWLYADVRGIGINNSGRPCSMRMYHSRATASGSVPPGASPAPGSALGCDYAVGTQRVSLWYR
jgi:hypothetical protein